MEAELTVSTGNEMNTENIGDPAVDSIADSAESASSVGEAPSPLAAAEAKPSGDEAASTSESEEQASPEDSTEIVAESGGGAEVEDATEPASDEGETPVAEVQKASEEATEHAPDVPEEPRTVAELAAPEPGMAWYVVHTYSGYEQKARLALEDRIKSKDMGDSFGRVLVPEEQVVERTKTGKTRNVSKRFFPGYILVEMDLNNETWHVVKDTPKVTGFVGGNTRKPSQVPPHEVARILGQMSQGAVETKPKITFSKGEQIRVVDGPFVNFNGVVDEVRPEKSTLRVMVSIFGRATPVELGYMQVEKD